jgi:hypothetical protein
VLVFKSAPPMRRALGTFRSDPDGAGSVTWDMRDSGGHRVGRGVYQVTAKQDYRYENKFIVIE